jgi:hypothetical protein
VGFAAIIHKYLILQRIEDVLRRVNWFNIEFWNLEYASLKSNSDGGGYKATLTSFTKKVQLAFTFAKEDDL